MPARPLPEPSAARQWLRTMLLIRRFEERAGEMYAAGRIGGFLHLAIGEEAVIVGAARALRPQDRLISTYRAHAHALVRGSEPGAVMAELFGRAGGLCRGRGGSTHLFDVANGFMGGFGIVAGHMPIAAGLALAADHQGRDEVTLCQLADGASSLGTFGETLNLAAMRCDGEDVVDTNAVAGEAVRAAREERRPVLVEAMTYRFRGHSTADPAESPSPEQVEEWRRRDPINTFGDRLAHEGVVSAQERDGFDREAVRRVDEAVAFAEASPEPDPAALHDDVYAAAGGER